MKPSELAPTSEEQLQWPLWGVYFVNRGAKGEAPDIPEARELLKLLEDWRRTVDSAPRAEIWKKMLALYTDQVFSIGTVDQHAAAGGPPQDAEERARQGALRLSNRPPISASICRTPSSLPMELNRCCATSFGASR